MCLARLGGGGERLADAALEVADHADVAAVDHLEWSRSIESRPNSRHWKSVKRRPVVLQQPYMRSRRVSEFCGFSLTETTRTLPPAASSFAPSRGSSWERPGRGRRWRGGRRRSDRGAGPGHAAECDRPAACPSHPGVGSSSTPMAFACADPRDQAAAPSSKPRSSMSSPPVARSAAARCGYSASYSAGVRSKPPLKVSIAEPSTR